MTLLVAIATHSHILLGGDNRMTLVDDESVFEDTVRKIYRVNDHTMIGFAGDHNLTVSCLHHLNQQSLSNATVQSVAKIMKLYLKEEYRKDNDIQQTVFIGGNR